MPLQVSSFQNLRSKVRVLCAAAFSLLVVGSVYAQSTDARFPTPVQTSEVLGTIAARDIGDARLTDYFYTFTGVPGDLLITFESRNLNGDLDIFTAGELRPLLKITVYAESGSPVTKSIYFRKRESLILRVEARSPNDDSGTYHIRFSGSFEPVAGGPLAAESEAKTAEPSKPSSGKRGTKVSSVGARIEEPAAEVAAAPTPAPTPAATETATNAPAKNARGRRPATRRTATKPPIKEAKEPAKTSVEAANETVADADAAKDAAKKAAKKDVTETETKPAATPTAGNVTAAGENKPVPANEDSKTANKRASARRGTGRRTPTPKPAPKPAVEPPAESGPRLVIEVKDGTRIEHFMTSVRRVTVENNQVVVVGRDGKVERVPMANVVRMSIGP